MGPYKAPSLASFLYVPCATSFREKKKPQTLDTEKNSALGEDLKYKQSLNLLVVGREWRKGSP